VERHARPGTRAPHLWLDDGDGRRIGVHDLFHDSFVLLCGPGGEEWARAAREVEGVRAHRVGADLVDVDGHWAERYGCDAVLVRPDGYVAWRSDPPERGPAADRLAEALHRVLH
jgi:putative polyketide hydroxylase